MILTHKVTLAAVLALGIAAPPARVAGDATPAGGPIAFAAPVIPPEAQQPDPSVEAELTWAADRLAAEVATARLDADAAFQLGRLDAVIASMEQAR